MTYTIGEVAEKMDLSIHTLRYYDKEGLLPFVERTESGRRIFSDRDIILLSTIECLKATGMSLKDIKQYVDWCVEGKETVPQRYELVVNQKKVLEDQMSQLQKMLDAINFKCDFYKHAIETGSTDLCDSERKEWADKVINGTFNK